MRARTVIRPALLGCLVACASGANADDTFDVLMKNGDVYSVTWETGAVQSRHNIGQRNWLDFQVAATGNTLEVYTRSGTFQGSTNLPGTIINGGFAFGAIAGIGGTFAGAMLDDGTFHILNIDDANNITPVAVMDHFRPGTIIGDLFLNDTGSFGRDRLYLLDVGNDRTLHFDSNTLEFIGAAPLGADLGPGAGMGGYRTWHLAIADDGTDMFYKRGQGGANLVPIADLSGLGEPAGVQEWHIPAPSGLMLLAIGAGARPRRRR